MAIIASQLLSGKKERDEEQLLQLFWNRAALKKEFAKLRGEGNQLTERLRQQEGANLRVQQRLEELEAMLTDPLRAQNALVFYQVRDVWLLCKMRLSRLADELVAHQTENEQRQLTERFEEARRARIESMDQQVANAQHRVNSVKDKLQAAYAEHLKLRGFWNYFRRRSLRTEAGALKESLKESSSQLERFRLVRKHKASQKGPKLEGLSTKGQRKINLSMIAIAQELYLHFSVRNISVMARETSAKSVRDANYGGIDQCRELMKYIEECVQELKANQKKLLINAQRRSAYLEKYASYRSESDTVPVAGSFAVTPLSDSETGKVDHQKSVAVNILAEEYWDIYSVLLT